MGGAAPSGGTGVGAGLGALAGYLLAPATGGASIAAATLLGAGLGASSGYSIDSAKSAAKASKGATEAAAREQQRQAAELQNQLLQKPKQVASDNFLATKNKALSQMRLGLASTIKGSAGGAPAPVLSAPSLTGSGGGKVTLGS